MLARVPIAKPDPLFRDVRCLRISSLEDRAPRLRTCAGARDSGFGKLGNMTPEEMVSRLLYRDGLMLVIDKPAGFAVHRGPKGGESLEDHFDALRFGLPRSPALAHRLDRDTSGCLVLGRHRKALAQLGKLFKAGAIAKVYWALVESGPEPAEGRIELPLGRLDVSRGRQDRASSTSHATRRAARAAIRFGLAPPRVRFRRQPNRLWRWHRP